MYTQITDKKQKVMRSGASKGFSLVQVSMILMVASLVLVNLLPTTQQKVQNQSSSTGRMKDIVTALRQYHVAYGRLPCPADGSLAVASANYGREAANPDTTTNCSGGTPAANATDSTRKVAIGIVPVATLGIPRDWALDAYGRHITYAVDTNATGYGWPSVSLSGTIAVTDNGNAATSVYALVSHGANGHGAWSPLAGSSGTAVKIDTGATDASELTNAHVDSSFATLSDLTSFVRTTPTTTFDDVVVYNSSVWTVKTSPALVPRISSVSPPAGCYSTGQKMSFTMTYDRAVTVTGTPRLTLTIGANTRYANYESGSGTAAIVFSYTVVGGDTGAVSVAALVDPNGGGVKYGTAYSVRGFTAPDLSAVKVNSCYIYVSDSMNYRVQYFDLSGNYVGQFGSQGSGDGQFGTLGGANYPATFDGPRGLYFDGTYLWVADPQNTRVQKFTATGTYVSQIAYSGGLCGSSGGCPRDVKGDSSGNIWLLDYWGHLQKFNSSGTLVGTYSTFGTSDGQISGGLSMAVDGSNNIWVSENDTVLRVQKFDNSGAFVSKIATTEFQIIAFSPDYSELWVAGNYAGTMVKYNTSGTQLGTYATWGGGVCPTTTNHVNTPSGMTVDASGNLYLSDYQCNQVYVYSSSGAYVTRFGTSGSGDGQFNGPTGIAFGR